MGLRQVFTLIFLFTIHTSASISSKFDIYIVRVESIDDATAGLSTHEDLDTWYHSFLPSSGSNTREEAPRMVHCYHNVFRGFAARLSSEHVKEMKNKPGFVSAEPNDVLYQDTTHSPAFLGLHQNVGFWGKSNYGKGVIIGVLDGGIYAEHPSFGDAGMAPPPAKWKGVCQLKPPLSCNKKLIGARSLSETDKTPHDINGHGTHVAATAAGNFLSGANVNGLANGTAVGIAPRAHLAVYKVCTEAGCNEHDTLAGIDAAIDDGVDIISMSLNRGNARPFYASHIAVGSYHAVQKGIFVSTSAGNKGPFSYSLSNEAPWMLTAGASTTDRKLRATAVLGNGVKLLGESGFQPKDFVSRQYPLFRPDLNARNCSKHLADDERANGKIVICELHYMESKVLKGIYVKKAGGVGMIMINQATGGYTTNTGAHQIPAAHVSYEDGAKVITYANSTSSPTAAISFQGTLIGDSHAPQVASFSARGPSRHGRGILKPDILGPGVNILAAWHESVDDRASTNTKSHFNLESGTSMSCPHLSGVAALLKSAHPDWSAAAIRSAMMTTADAVNLAGKPIQDEKGLVADVFATGSGHVNPVSADNPGLVYDIGPEDYLAYVCGLNYTAKQIGVFLQQNAQCTTRIAEAQLNYPSFSIVFEPDVQKYTRTVTNVGKAASVYVVKVAPPANVKVTVTPEQLSFTRVNQKLSYEVTFQIVKPFPQGYSGQGSITWTSQSHTVRIPIAAQPL